MDDRVARLESTVAILNDRVRDLELRLIALDRGWDGTPGSTATTGVDPLVEGLERAPVQQWLALAGRIFLVLGGAYLLRALTDSQVFPPRLGVALGLLYGAPWLLLAARAGARGAQLDAFCHALATALIGYPLVWEATVRFKVLGSADSAALLAGLTAAALVLSAVTRLQGLAWVVTTGALASAVTLAAATRDWTSYTLLSIALGFGTLWLAYLRNWGVCWLAAVGVDFMLLVVTGRAAVSGAVLGALALHALMFIGYIGSVAWTTIVHPRAVTAFDVAQGGAAILLALGGAIVVLQANGSAVAIGIVACALGIAAYFAAFGFVRQHRQAGTFVFWSSFALVLSLTGATVSIGPAGAAIVFAISALASVAAGRSERPLGIDLHGAAFALAATIASGLLGVATLALVRPPSAWRALDLVSLVAFAALAATVLIPTRHDARRIPRLVLVTALLWTSMGVAVWMAAQLVGEARRIDASLLATLRTAVLIGATLLLARVARYDGGREAGWLMYPMLVITGLKLLFFDLPLGRPQTLFAALALYGFALIAAPRLTRGRDRNPGSEVRDPGPPKGGDYRESVASGFSRTRIADPGPRIAD